MGFWGRWLGPGRKPDAGKMNRDAFRRRGEPALTRARDMATQRGWVALEQDEQLLAEALAELSDFGFIPSFIPNMAYVIFCLNGDIRRFRSFPHRTLLRIRNLEGQPLFTRVLLPAPDAVTEEDSYVDLLWEAAAAAGASEYLSGVSWGMDFQDTRSGFLNYTFAQRRHSVHIIIDLNRWDPTALRTITTSVTPSKFDLIYDGVELFCWVDVKRADRFVALLANPDS